MMGDALKTYWGCLEHTDAWIRGRLECVSHLMVLTPSHLMGHWLSRLMGSVPSRLMGVLLSDALILE